MISNSYPQHREYRGLVSDSDVALWKAGNQPFEQLEYTSSPDMVAMSQAGAPERVGLQHVSPGFFPMMGVGAFLGSLDTYEDFKRPDYPGGGVVLSYEFWQRHFASDPKVLGRSIFVDNYMSTIGAVLNPNFNLFGTRPAEMYAIDPVPDPGGPPSGRWLFGLGKLKSGVSVDQAQASMDVEARHLGQAYPDLYKDVGIKVEPLQQGLFGWSKAILFPLFAAVAFVLLIACVNVANLLLVRGAARREGDWGSCGVRSEPHTIAAPVTDGEHTAGVARRGVRTDPDILGTEAVCGPVAQRIPADNNRVDQYANVSVYLKHMHFDRLLFWFDSGTSSGEARRQRQFA
jgi:MacB-like periplasmic core domain